MKKTRLMSFVAMALATALGFSILVDSVPAFAAKKFVITCNRGGNCKNAVARAANNPTARFGLNNAATQRRTGAVLCKRAGSNKVGTISLSGNFQCSR